MMRAWPTVEEERAVALGQKTPWRRLSIAMQVVLFVLTIIGVGAFYALSDLLHFPPGRMTLIAALATAEMVIRRTRFWRTGVEAALWLGGLFAFIFSLPSSGKPEAILLFAAAAAIAGLRVRHALFGTLAMVLVCVYLAARDWRWAAFGLAIAITVIAAAALTRMIRRPSTEALWEVSVMVMPLAGYGCAKRDFASNAVVIAMYATLAILFLAVAMRFRMRVLLLAMVVSTAIAVVEAHDFIPLSVEWELIVAGALILALATVIIRLLRSRERGFVLDERKREEEDLLQIAAMLPLGTPAAPQPADQTPTGGEFGGAGASGTF
jgi:hypothetical protein